MSDSATSSRRKAGVGFAVMAAVLALASAAFGCTVFKGDMTFTVSPDAAGGSSSQTVKGNGTGMGWCGGEPAWTITTDDATAETISITSGPATACNTSGTNKLRNGTYTVGLAHAYMGQGGLPHTNCHSSSLTSTSLGNYTVDNGSGGKTGGAAQSYNYTSNALPGYNNICVYDQGSADANDVNINITMI